MADAVLDASAILAVVFDEPGAAQVEAHLSGAAVSAVNVAEVVTKFLELGMPDETARTVVDGLQMDIHPLTAERAYAIAALRGATRSAGLSIGDRACLALAKELHLPAVTADRIWKTVADDIGVTVECIR